MHGKFYAEQITGILREAETQIDQGEKQCGLVDLWPSLIRYFIGGREFVSSRLSQSQQPKELERENDLPSSH